MSDHRWSKEQLKAELVEAMGPHRKAELAVEHVLPELLAMLWEARDLNLKRIDELRRRVSNLESAMNDSEKYLPSGSVEVEGEVDALLQAIGDAPVGAPRFDVLGVSLMPATKYVVRVMERGLTKENAEAYIKIAVMRRGVNEEFFAEAPAGMYHEGDEWKGTDDADLS